MGKLFGTDGIRGVANETLDAKLAYRVGQAAAISLADDSGTKPTVVIGKDTRISSDMLEGALVAGLTACGCNAILLGVIPTPAVAYLTVYLHADAGVVISASHNPYEHNGIKMFSSEGFKLSDALEARIEELILREGELPVKTHGQIGQVMSGSFAAEYYLDHLASTVEDLEPLRVLIACCCVPASTMTRMSGSVPDGRMSTRPFSPSSSSAARMADCREADCMMAVFWSLELTRTFLSSCGYCRTADASSLAFFLLCERMLSSCSAASWPSPVGI